MSKSTGMGDIQVGHFDVQYSIASLSLTTAATVVVASTGAYYHGLSILAGTAAVTVTIYDNSSTALGNIIDIRTTTAGAVVVVDKQNPVYAKAGLVALLSGSIPTGTIFYSPKG